MDKVDNDRSLLLRYLAAKGLTDRRRVGMVDIGWRGTIQDNIAILLPEVSFKGYYLGLQRYLNPQPKNTTKAAFGPNANTGLDSIQLLDGFVPLEMLCNSSNGSVEGYIDTTDGIVARRRVDDAENVAYEQFSKNFQEGVVFAAERWRAYLENYAVTSAELRGFAMQVWSTICEKSPKELVEVFLQSPQNDIFGFGDFLDKRDIPSLGKIFRGAFNGDDRRDVIQYIIRTQWSPALKHRKDIHAVHRCALLSLIAVARKYKHLRMRYAHLKAVSALRRNGGGDQP
jgi:hypothetical protein